VGLEIRRLSVPRRDQTEALRLHQEHWLRLAVAVVLRLLVQMLSAALLVEMAATEPHHLFRVPLLLMLAVAVALLFLPAH
jgi:hypothetical protein